MRKLVRESLDTTNFTRGVNPYKKLNIGSSRKFKRGESIRMNQSIYIDTDDSLFGHEAEIKEGDILTYQEIDGWDGKDLEHMHSGPYFYESTLNIMVHGKWMTWFYDNPDAYERLGFIKENIG